jgi:hypothetical protein
MLALPALGPGYGPQYAYWSIPLLVATYCLFDNGWRRSLLVFYGLAVLTYAVEYGLFLSHGAFLEVIFPDSHLVGSASQRFTQPEWQSFVRLPLFLGALAILAVGGLHPRRAEPTTSK